MTVSRLGDHEEGEGRECSRCTPIHRPTDRNRRILFNTHRRAASSRSVDRRALIHGHKIMKPADAMQFFGLTGELTETNLKKAFRAAAKKYHPDVNPAGAEMMKAVNDAFDTLKPLIGETITPNSTTASADYPEALNAALNAVFGLSGIEIEICGNWAWVSGETYPHRTTLKTAGFKFAGKKKAWHFRPDEWASKSRGSTSMDEIRATYGSAHVTKGQGRRLAGASS